MHIGSILIYNPETAPGGFVRFKDILGFFGSADAALQARCASGMVRVPFDLDYPYWVEDPDFDLEYHVRHVALPQPGDWRQLCIQAARIFARPLDLDPSAVGVHRGRGARQYPRHSRGQLCDGDQGAPRRD
jgi:diacylglycerol O-acyltransferase